MNLSLHILKDKLEERIKLKDWSSNNGYNLFYVVTFNNIEHLVVMVYNFEKWKQLILTTEFTNDQLIDYFINFISEEVPYLRGEKILFYYDNKIKTNYEIKEISDNSYGISLTIK